MRSPNRFVLLTSCLALGSPGFATQVSSPLPRAGTVFESIEISSDTPSFLDTLDLIDQFGFGLAAVGDRDGDGRIDLAAGVIGDDDAGPASDAGAVWILQLKANGSIATKRKISQTQGGLGEVLSPRSFFGHAIADLGDLDGDGIGDIAVGAPGPGTGPGNSGAVWILFMTLEGNVRSSQRIAEGEGGFAADLEPGAGFGRALCSPGDLDGDGVRELVVGAPFQDFPGAVWILFLDRNGTVKAEQEIGSATGGFAGTLQANDRFGAALAHVGDRDGNGVGDIAVGAPAQRSPAQGPLRTGTLWLICLNRDGTVASTRAIGSALPGPSGQLEVGDAFGCSVARLGDLDGDGVEDLAVGAQLNDGACSICNNGAVWILFLDPDGAVQRAQKIDRSNGGFQGALGNSFFFGASLASLGDLDGDGTTELAVGVPGDDDGGINGGYGGLGNNGATWILGITPEGMVKTQTKLSDEAGGFEGTLEEDDRFGASLAVADIDGDGVEDWAVGATINDRAGVRLLSFEEPGKVRSSVELTASQGTFPAEFEKRSSFGRAVAFLQDLDGDRVPELAIGESSDDGGFSSTAELGAVLVTFLEEDGSVKRVQKIAENTGGFQGMLPGQGRFGAALASIGDLDGDGRRELAVGAPGGLSTAASIWILSLSPHGTVQSETQILRPQGSTGFGESLADLGDLDGDGSGDLAVGAPSDEDGQTNAGAVWILFLWPDGSLKYEQKISQYAGGLQATLRAYGGFGSSLAPLGDLDGDGNGDLAVGHPFGRDEGAVWVLFLNGDGTVKDEREIPLSSAGFSGLLEPGDGLGISLAAFSPSSQGIRLAAGAWGSDDGGKDHGAVWILSLAREPSAPLLELSPAGR